jgi:uncharacterized membrane protein
LTTTDHLGPPVPIARHLTHTILFPIPLVCFAGAFITDIAYWATAEMMWADFSAWLLVIGLVFGVLAAIAGVIDFVGRRRIRTAAPAWPHALGSAAMLVLAFFNALIHSRDAWTSVVPTGLILSFITVLILPFTGMLGWSLVHRQRPGVVK